MGAVHPLAEPEGRGPTTTTATSARGPTCAPRAGCSGRPRPRRVADLDGDGHNEVIGLPNAEMNEALRDPEPTRSWSSTARRTAARGPPAAIAASPHLPLSRKPAVRGPKATTTRRAGIPAPTVVDIAERSPAGDRFPRSPTATVYAIGPTGRCVRRYDYAHGRAKTFASEVVAADLNRDGTPRARLRHLRAGAELGTPRGALGGPAGSSSTSACATRAATATASACRRRRPSPTSTATGAWRSFSRASITGSTSIACPAPGTNMPAVADGARQPAAQRHGPGDGSLGHRSPPLPSRPPAARRGGRRGGCSDGASRITASARAPGASRPTSSRRSARGAAEGRRQRAPRRSSCACRARRARCRTTSRSCSSSPGCSWSRSPPSRRRRSRGGRRGRAGGWRSRSRAGTSRPCRSPASASTSASVEVGAVVDRRRAQLDRELHAGPEPELVAVHAQAEARVAARLEHGARLVGVERARPRRRRRSSARAARTRRASRRRRAAT